MPDQPRRVGMTVEEMQLWVMDADSPFVRSALRRLARSWTAWPRPYASATSRRFGAALRDAERQLAAAAAPARRRRAS